MGEKVNVFEGLKNAPNWGLLLMAGPTRLERATSSVTGRRSNQLSYEPALIKVYMMLRKNAR